MNNEIVLLDTDDEQPDMQAEYDFSQAKPNRFAKSLSIQLDPDVAAFFQTSEAVNHALRMLMRAMPEKYTVEQHKMDKIHP